MLASALTVLAVAGATLLAPAQAPGGEPSAPVATVDGQAIERQSFDRWERIAARSIYSSLAPDPETGYRRCVAARRRATPAEKRRTVTDKELRRACAQDYASLRDQVMQLLISFRWIEGEAAAQGLVVTDAEVTREFEQQKRQSFPKDADFRRFLKQSGQTEADILARVRLDLLSNQIRDRAIAGRDQVSDEAIADFYAVNRERFAVPERRALRVVLTKRAAEAKAARAALEGGESWASVARRYSIDPASKRDGKLSTKRGVLTARLDRAVFRAAKGKLVGPVRTQHGAYVFTVTKVVRGRQRRLAEVEQEIRQTLVAQAQDAALTAFVRDFTARWRAKTECAAGYETSDCRNGPAPEA
jgi:foldase protein PrsA